MAFASRKMRPSGDLGPWLRNAHFRGMLRKCSWCGMERVDQRWRSCRLWGDWGL